MTQTKPSKIKSQLKNVFKAGLAGALLFTGCTPNMTKQVSKQQKDFELCHYEPGSSDAFSNSFYEDVLQASANYLTSQGLKTSVVDFEDSNECNPVVFEEPISYLEGIYESDNIFFKSLDKNEISDSFRRNDTDFKKENILDSAFQSSLSTYKNATRYKIEENDNIDNLITSFIFENINTNIEEKGFFQYKKLENSISSLGYQGIARFNRGGTQINLLSNLTKMNKIYEDDLFQQTLYDFFDSKADAFKDQLAAVVTHEFLHGLYLEHNEFSKNRDGSPLSPCEKEFNIMQANSYLFMQLDQLGLSSFQKGAAIYFSNQDNLSPFPLDRPVIDFIEEHNISRKEYECD